MNRHYRTISTLLRHDWAVDEAWAISQLPLINSYLAGNFNASMVGKDEAKKPIGFVMVEKTKASSSARSQVGTGQYVQWAAPADRQAKPLAGEEAQFQASGSLFSDESIPAGSVAILDVRGAIMKEGFCGSYGTEDYTAELNAVYANDALIGAVILVDSGGGQLSGTPSFYDAIRNPIKPTGVVVNDGIMASAAYWLGCGADFIWASQPTDQIGSIGVFCKLRDNTEYLKQNGFKEFSVYASRSKDKNKPVRDALKGDNKALTAELDQAVGHFENAVRQGRGDKLVVNDDEPFTGKLYYADEAIAIGLIDGYGDLNAAIAKVTELAEAQASGSAKTGAGLDNKLTTTTTSTLVNASAASNAPEALPSATQEGDQAPSESNSNSNQTQDEMFGDKHKNLTALAGVEASAITDEQLNAINANLDGLNITGARVISTSYLQEAEQAITNLETADQTIATLTQERDAARKDAEKFGEQPGHVGSKSPKQTEPTAGGEKDEVISEADAERRRLQAQAKV